MIKATTANPRFGNPTPCGRNSSGMLNAIGLQTLVLMLPCSEKLPWLQEHYPELPIIANVAGFQTKNMQKCLTRFPKPATSLHRAQYLLSKRGPCGTGLLIGQVPELAFAAVKASVFTLMCPSLTPSVADITSVAKAVEDAGAIGFRHD